MLSLINRGQIKPQDFVTEASGAVSLKADARKLMFQALQAKKARENCPSVFRRRSGNRFAAVYSGHAVGAALARRFSGISAVFDEIGLQAT